MFNDGVHLYSDGPIHRHQPPCPPNITPQSTPIMCDTASLKNENGLSSGGVLERPSHNSNDSSGDQRAASVAENSKPPSINAAALANPLNEEGEQPAAVEGKQSDERIENLMALFRDFLEAAPNPAISKSAHTQRNTAGRKRLFGLNKGLSPETGSNNPYDYEQIYPRDQPGEEAADNARVWLTYLDEAQSFDRERVEGWKDTVDVLLVFAGLFSGVITTFVSQASQSLQQDNTQVLASLLFEITRLLRAQSSGTPLNNIPSSSLTPPSPFTPSMNALLVNGLWFTSLAIALSTALFAVLAKQWLHYYLTSITGTAQEKARARQLRFKGFELWKVGAIVELLPILLYIAVGMFLTGIIILLFPLDVRVAWTLVVITGITYALYFISVLLPIQYPECPYTTSLTIYVGILVFALRRILCWVSSRTLEKGFQAVWRRINSNARHTIRRLLDNTQLHFINGLLYTSRFIRRGFRTLRPTIFADGFPKFTNWRGENIKNAVRDAGFLDFEALDWLYATSPNRSVHRIIARCAAVHPSIGQKFGPVICDNLLQTLEISETNVVDLRYGLCLDIMTPAREHWDLLRYIPDVEESHLEEAECRSYSHIADNVIHHNHAQVMKDVIKNDLELPLVMWSIFFERVSGDATIAGHILTSPNSELSGLFQWKCDPTRGSIPNTGVVALNSEELGWWKFSYVYRHFFNDTKPDYSVDKTFETRYRLLITIYRDLTSDEPLIADKEQRQQSLRDLFNNFWDWQVDSKPHSVSHEQYFAFFIDICCEDAFWSESMTHRGRHWAVWCLNSIWDSMYTDVANQFPFTECHNLSPIYQWCSRDLNWDLSWRTTPIFAVLFMPQNRNSLCTLLSNDPDAVSHLSKCFQNMRNCNRFISKIDIFQNLMKILKNPKVHLFNVLYNPSVLAQLWGFLVIHRFDTKRFLLVVKSNLDREKLDDLYAAMTQAKAQSGDWEDYVYARYIKELGYDKGTDILDALEASAREFAQMIGASHLRLETTIQQSAPEHVGNKNHDSEERAQLEVPDAIEVSSQVFHLSPSAKAYTHSDLKAFTP